MIRSPWRLAPALLALVPAAMTTSGCATGETRPDERRTGTQSRPSVQPDVYEAQLAPLNVTPAAGPTTGRVRLLRRGDALEISVDVAGAPPGMVHIQHIHGFVDGQPATCANVSSDANGDGIVDLLETEPTSGTTLIPFHGEPTSLEIAGEGYPEADSTGAYHYRATVSASELEQALQQAHDGAALELGQRVIYVHGVYEDADLPASVASLPEVPAHVTLPIACGEVRQTASAADAPPPDEGANP